MRASRTVSTIAWARECPSLTWRSTSSATVRFSPRADGLYHEHSSTHHVSVADALKVRCVFNNVRPMSERAFEFTDKAIPWIECGSRSAVTLPFARQRAALHNRRFHFSLALSSVLRTQRSSDSHSGMLPKTLARSLCLNNTTVVGRNSSRPKNSATTSALVAQLRTSSPARTAPLGGKLRKPPQALIRHGGESGVSQAQRPDDQRSCRCINRKNIVFEGNNRFAATGVG